MNQSSSLRCLHLRAVLLPLWHPLPLCHLLLLCHLPRGILFATTPTLRLPHHLSPDNRPLISKLLPSQVELLRRHETPMPIHFFSPRRRLHKSSHAQLIRPLKSIRQQRRRNALAFVVRMHKQEIEYCVCKSVVVSRSTSTRKAANATGT